MDHITCGTVRFVGRAKRADRLCWLPKLDRGIAHGFRPMRRITRNLLAAGRMCQDHSSIASSSTAAMATGTSTVLCNESETAPSMTFSAI